jgi:hypothetical protein
MEMNRQLVGISVALLVVAYPVTASAAASHRTGLNYAPGEVAAIKACSIDITGETLRVGPEGGAKMQTYVINEDCTVSKGEVVTLTAGTPEFAAFLASRQARSNGVAGLLPADSASCNSDLDYTDLPGYILTYTQLWQGWLWDPYAGQVIWMGSYDAYKGASIDGWYFISDATYPYLGPLPWGTVVSAYYAEFAWIGGSFWHSHRNNNRMDGFGYCDGWPETQGSVVPGGSWVWTIWKG